MKLTRINTLLLVIIVLINGYIICAPLMPLATFWFNRHATTQPTRLNAILHPSAAGPTHTAPADNRLVIPGMLLDVHINEGKNAAALRDGPWRRPNTSTPDKGGNTVIAAHRFTYTQPQGTFYHLDIVRVGDGVGIFWEGKRYLYTVREVKTVPATATTIETPTADSRLTLYTCTPLWSPKDRLVVIAELTEHP